MQIYCIRCKKKTPSQDEKEVVMKNGRRRMAAICSDCGSKKSLILGK